MPEGSEPGVVGKTVPRSWFTASIAFGLVLAACLVVALATSKPAWLSFTSPTSQGPSGPDILGQLRRMGVDNREAKRALLAIVAARTEQTVPFEYWLSPALRAVREQLASFERDERTRAALSSELGAEAANDPAFATLFRPYDREFPQFSSLTQLRLQALAAGKAKSVLERGSPIGFMTVGRLPPDFDAVGNALTPQENFEFMLRESPLAYVLASADFDFTEKEFRDVFRALAAARPDSILAVTPSSLEAALSDPSVLAALQSALGAERLARFQRGRDPAYGLLRRVADLKHIPQEKMDEAYLLLSAEKTASTAARPGTDTVPAELETLLGPVDAANVYRLFQVSRSRAALARQAPPGSDSPIPGRPVRSSPGMRVQ